MRLLENKVISMRYSVSLDFFILPSYFNLNAMLPGSVTSIHYCLLCLERYSWDSYLLTGAQLSIKHS